MFPLKSLLFPLLSLASFSAQAHAVPHALPLDLALSARAELVVQPECLGGQALSSHDCNVALLGLGGGIQGAIQFLRVDALTNSSTSGGCAMTVNVADGGMAIDISKGRLEQAQKTAIAACGQQAWSVTAAGGSVGGNLQIVQSAA